MLINIILMLSIYLPFEDFLLKWLPVSEGTYMYLRQVPDVIVLFIFALLFLSSAFRDRLRVPSKDALLYLSLFIVFSGFTVLLNGSSFLNALVSVKALVRYVFLVFILYLLKPTKTHAIFFVKMVIGIAFVEATVGFSEFLGGEAIREFFRPRLLSGEWGIRFGTVLRDDTFGTMAYTINYASFLLLAIIFLIIFGRYIGYRRQTMWSCGAYFLMAILLSGSRAVFLTTFLAIGIIIMFRHGIRIVVYLAGFSLVAMYALLFMEHGTSYKDFWYFLSPNVFDVMESQRFGMVRIFIEYVTALDRHLFFGLSPDKDHIIQYIIGNYRMPVLFSSSTLIAIEDVFWIAIVFYYGIIGVGLFMMLIYNIYMRLKATEAYPGLTEFQADMVLSSKVIMLTLLPLNFLNQMFSVRTFSFYVWTMVGLTFAVSRYAARDKVANEDITN